MRSWSEEAETLGFLSERQMMESLYLVKRFSIRRISHLLGPAPTQIREKLLELGIEMRGRGGANNEGNLKLAELTDAQLLERPSAALAHTHGVSPSTVIKERRRRKLHASRVRFKGEEGGEGVPSDGALVDTENQFLPGEL